MTSRKAKKRVAGRRPKKADDGPWLPGMRQSPLILQHPLFMAIAQFVKVEVYDRDGGHSHPRFRFEWQKGVPTDIGRAALEIECACAKCGATIRPFRLRKKNEETDGLGHIYLAVTCPLDVRKGCARSKVAADTYTAIAALLGHRRAA